MALDELTQTRLITLAVVLAIVAYCLLGRAKGQRRQTRFAALARSLGSEVVREGEFLSRFPVDIAGRMFDVRLQHIGRGAGAAAAGGMSSRGWRCRGSRSCTAWTSGRA